MTRPARSRVIIAISAESSEAVDQLAERALAAGATPHEYRMEMDGMHGRAFADLDGHQWEGAAHRPGLLPLTRWTGA